MTVFDYDLAPDAAPKIGLIVLQADQRIEQDFRRLIPDEASLYVSRVPSGLQVTADTLQQMEQDIPQAVSLLPASLSFDAIGYGCTSGSAQIGPARVAELVHDRAQVRAVTDPLTALVAACRALGLRRLAFLSPYIEQVSSRLRAALAEDGIETPVFGSFAEAEEARVVRISPESLVRAVRDLVPAQDVDGVFLSCTNLNTLDIVENLEAETGRPVLSSNLVLAWHLCQLSGVSMRADPACQLAAVSG